MFRLFSSKLNVNIQLATATSMDMFLSHLKFFQALHAESNPMKAEVVRCFESILCMFGLIHN